MRTEELLAIILTVGISTVLIEVILGIFRKRRERKIGEMHASQVAEIVMNRLSLAERVAMTEWIRDIKKEAYYRGKRNTEIKQIVGGNDE